MSKQTDVSKQTLDGNERLHLRSLKYGNHRAKKRVDSLKSVLSGEMSFDDTQIRFHKNSRVGVKRLKKLVLTRFRHKIIKILMRTVTRKTASYAGPTIYCSIIAFGAKKA